MSEPLTLVIRAQDAASSVLQHVQGQVRGIGAASQEMAAKAVAAAHAVGAGFKGIADDAAKAAAAVKRVHAAAGSGEGAAGMAALKGALSAVGSAFSAVAAVAGAVLTGILGLLGSVLGAVLELAEKIVGALGSALETIGGIALRVGGVLGGVLGAAAVAFGVAGIKANIFEENLTRSLTAMMHNRDAAKEAVEWLRQFAAVRPFDTESIDLAAQKLIAFGLDWKSLLPVVTDVSSVMRTLRPEDVADILGRLSSGMAGVRELAELGLKPESLRKQGLRMDSNGEPMDRRQVLPAAVRALNEQFGGASEATGGFDAVWTTLTSGFKHFAQVATKGFFDQMKGGLGKLGDEFEKLATSGGIVKALAVPFNLLAQGVSAAADALPGFVAWLQKVLTAQNVTAFLKDVWANITGVYGAVMEFVNALSGGKSFGEIWESFRSEAVEAIGIVREVWGGFVAGVKYLVDHRSEIWDAIKDAISQIEAALEKVKTVAEWVVGIFAAAKIWEIAAAIGGIAAAIGGAVVKTWAWAAALIAVRAAQAAAGGGAAAAGVGSAAAGGGAAAAGVGSAAAGGGAAAAGVGSAAAGGGAAAAGAAAAADGGTAAVTAVAGAGLAITSITAAAAAALAIIPITAIDLTLRKSGFDAAKAQILSRKDLTPAEQSALIHEEQGKAVRGWGDYIPDAVIGKKAAALRRREETLSPEEQEIVARVRREGHGSSAAYNAAVSPGSAVDTAAKAVESVLPAKAASLAGGLYDAVKQGAADSTQPGTAVETGLGYVWHPSGRKAAVVPTAPGVMLAGSQGAGAGGTAAAGGAADDGQNPQSLKQAADRQEAFLNAMAAQAKAAAEGMRDTTQLSAVDKALEEARRSADQARLLVPALRAKQAGLMAAAKGFATDTKEYWELSKQYWDVQSQITGINQGSMRAQVEAQKAVTEHTVQLADAQAAYVEAVSKNDPALRNNPMKALQERMKNVVPLLIEKYKALKNAVIPGESDVERIKRQTQAEDTKGEILKAAGADDKPVWTLESLMNLHRAQQQMMQQWRQTGQPANVPSGFDPSAGAMGGGVYSPAVRQAMQMIKAADGGQQSAVGGQQSGGKPAINFAPVINARQDPEELKKLMYGMVDQLMRQAFPAPSGAGG